MNLSPLKKVNLLILVYHLMLLKPVLWPLAEELAAVEYVDPLDNHSLIISHFVVHSRYCYVHTKKVQQSCSSQPERRPLTAEGGASYEAVPMHSGSF